MISCFDQLSRGGGRNCFLLVFGVTRIYPLVAVTLLYDRLGVEKISLSGHSTFEWTFEWTLFFMTDSTVSIGVD